MSVQIPLLDLVTCTILSPMFLQFDEDDLGISYSHTLGRNVVPRVLVAPMSQLSSLGLPLQVWSSPVVRLCPRGSSRRTSFLRLDDCWCSCISTTLASTAARVALRLVLLVRCWRLRGEFWRLVEEELAGREGQCSRREDSFNL